MEQESEMTVAAADSEDGLMACDAVVGKIIGVVSEVIGVPRSELSLDTRASDLEAWDSFAHVRIVLAVDQAFGVHLSMEAIERADGIAGLVEAVEDAKAGV